MNTEPRGHRWEQIAPGARRCVRCRIRDADPRAEAPCHDIAAELAAGAMNTEPRSDAGPEFTDEFGNVWRWDDGRAVFVRGRGRRDMADEQ
jgi:hypothetical protein